MVKPILRFVRQEKNSTQTLIFSISSTSFLELNILIQKFELSEVLALN